jgi:hypothetical protein
MALGVATPPLGFVVGGQPPTDLTNSLFFLKKFNLKKLKKNMVLFEKCYLFPQE